VDEVVIIPNVNHLCKVKFSNISSARSCLDNGILLYNQSVPSTNTEKEIFIRLNPCFVCYSYKHQSANCPNPNLKKCSECAGDGHTYKECKSEAKKCLNCGDDHRTLAARCPVRKKIIKDREKLERENKIKQRKSYAQVTKGVVSQEVTEAKNTELIEEVRGRDKLPTNASVVILTSITWAHYLEEMYPGTFQETMDEMLKLNGMASVKFPSKIPKRKDVAKESMKTPEAIRDALAKEAAGLPGRVGGGGMLSDATDTETETEPMESTTQRKRKAKTHSSVGYIGKRHRDSDVSTESESMPPPRAKGVEFRDTREKEWNAKDLGLQVAVPEGIDFDEAHQNNNEHLMEMVFIDKKLKYFFTNTYADAETVETNIRRGKIKLTEASFRKFNAYHYGRIRNGGLHVRDRKQPV